MLTNLTQGDYNRGACGALQIAFQLPLSPVVAVIVPTTMVVILFEYENNIWLNP